MVEYIKDRKVALLNRHKIPYLASYDVTDFASACAAEGIVLLSDIEEAKRHIPSV
ncbi:MAG: hypothetical protein WA960_11040 [Tunicatimonas sp.]